MNGLKIGLVFFAALASVSALAEPFYRCRDAEFPEYSVEIDRAESGSKSDAVIRVYENAELVYEIDAHRRNREDATVEIEGSVLDDRGNQRGIDLVFYDHGAEYAALAEITFFPRRLPNLNHLICE